MQKNISLFGDLFTGEEEISSPQTKKISVTFAEYKESVQVES